MDKGRRGGSFHDFDALFEQLESAPVMELSKPLPSKRHLPKAPVGRCPASHNQALFGKGGN